MGQEGEKVVLYIYDLSQGMARQLSTTFLGQTIDGVWHTGVGVYGKEYFFGGGIQCVPAGRTPFGTPVQVTELGYTQIPKEIFEEYLRELGPRYTMKTYSLLHHNCNHFSDEVAQFLVGTGIPQHILRLPEEAMSSPLGAFLLPRFQQLETTLRYGGVPVVPQPIPQNTPNFGSISVPAAPARSTSRMSTSGVPPVATTASIPRALSPVSVPAPAPPNCGHKSLSTGTLFVGGSFRRFSSTVRSKKTEWSKVGVKKGIQGLSTETAYTMQGQYLKYGSGHFVEREKAGVKRAELATIPGDLVEGWARVASK